MQDGFAGDELKFPLLNQKAGAAGVLKVLMLVYVSREFKVMYLGELAISPYHPQTINTPTFPYAPT